MRFLRLLNIHRWISLSFVVLWALQATSGLAIGYRANIDDFFLGQSSTDTNAAAISDIVANMQRNGDEISSFWKSGGVQGQYDIYLKRDGVDRTVRINGSGGLIRDRSDARLFSDGAVFETLTTFHSSLMLGAFGYAILFVSGILLISNISLAIVMGWSRRDRLKTFSQAKGAPSAVILGGWHWRIGLWGAIPAIVVIVTGTALTQSDALESGLGVIESLPTLSSAESTTRINLEEAINTALSEYPDSELVAAYLPTADKNWYKFRLNAPGEMPRLYGATRVYIGLDGKVLLDHDATKSAANERITEALYPVHTGQIGGVFGRLLNTAVGLWLLIMAFLGLRLWLSRRRNKQQTAASAID